MHSKDHFGQILIERFLLKVKIWFEKKFKYLIISSLDEKKLSGVIFLDFSKTFDSVDSKSHSKSLNLIQKIGPNA